MKQATNHVRFLEPYLNFHPWCQILFSVFYC